MGRIAPVTRLFGGDRDHRAAANALVSDFKRRRPDGLIVVNTTAIADLYRALEDQGVRDALAWIHELPASIDESYGGPETIALIERVASRILVPSQYSRGAILSRYDVPASKIVSMPNGIARSIERGAQVVDRQQARRSLRALIGADEGALVVLGCGRPEGRKGVDLFGLVAADVCTRAPDLPVHFVWLGKEIEPEFRMRARAVVEATGYAGRLHFIGSSGEPEVVYAGVDLVLITSRVDVSPLVNAEAMLFGLPVVFFEGGGGVGEQHPPGLGLGVVGFDTRAMADRALDLLHDDRQRRELGGLLRAHAQGFVSWRQFGERFDQVGVEPAPAVEEVITSRAPPERRILLILPDIEIGGGQLNAIRLANALTATHQVFLVNARPDQYDPVVAQLISPAVIPLEGGLHRLPWYDQAEPWVRDSNNTDERAVRIGVVVELIKQFQISTVMSQVWWSDRFALALRERVPFAWFVKLCGCYEALLSAPITDPAFFEKAPRIFRLATGVTYGSAENLRLFADRRFPRPRAMRRVFNGFTRALIDRQTAPTPPRSRSDMVFCICSRAIRDKGWEEAILAVSRINRLPPSDRGGKRARLWLIGDGPALPPLKDRYSGETEVVFLGSQIRPHSIMAAADVGLLPSYTESMPTAVIESLACDRPVVATAVGAVPQMLVHGTFEAGMLVPVLEDHPGVAIEALVGAMLRYMVDGETYEKHQHATRPVFDAHFDLSATVDNYLSFFAEARR